MRRRRETFRSDIFKLDKSRLEGSRLIDPRVRHLDQ